MIKHQKHFFILLVFLALNSALAQTTKQEAMEKLSVFTGNWVGTSMAFKNGKQISEIAAFEKIQFKLNKHILTIDLASESLQLHTVIYFDEKLQTYFYNPFYKNGAAKYSAKFINNRLIVSPSKTKRFIFMITKEGNFKEYGEQLKNGNWEIYFEDIFKKIN